MRRRGGDHGGPGRDCRWKAAHDRVRGGRRDRLAGWTVLWRSDPGLRRAGGLDGMRLSLLSDLNTERAARRAAVLVTDVASGEQRIVREAEVGGDPLAQVLKESLRRGKSGLVERDDRQFFLTVQTPPVRLVV